VEKVYRGTCEEGETIRMLLPGAVSGNIHSSIMDTLGELKVDFNAWNAMPPQRPSVLSAFLGRITRNLSFNRYKLLHSQKRGGGELPLIFSELGDCVSGKDSVEQKIDGKELLSEINGFLAGLSKEKRQMFVRRYWYAEPVKEIAQRFGVSEGSATMTLKRMRLQLKEVLMKRGYML